MEYTFYQVDVMPYDDNQVHNALISLGINSTGLAGYEWQWYLRKESSTFVKRFDMLLSTEELLLLNLVTKIEFRKLDDY